MLSHVRTSRYPTWMMYNSWDYACRDRIVVSTLSCGRNYPGSNPGLGKYFIHYSAMPLIYLLTRCIMRFAFSTLRCGRNNPGASHGGVVKGVEHISTSCVSQHLSGADSSPMVLSVGI